MTFKRRFMYQIYKMSILLYLFEVAVQISVSVSTLAKYKNSQKKLIVGRRIVKIKLLSIIQLNLFNQICLGKVIVYLFIFWGGGVILIIDKMAFNDWYFWGVINKTTG